MNFSDETKKRLMGAVQKGRYMASRDIVSGNVAATTKEIDSRILATILSSLTLADLMQVDEVRKLLLPWQPIETIPRDGERVRLLNKDGLLDIGSWYNAEGFPLQQQLETVNGHGDYTHWMPRNHGDK